MYKSFHVKGFSAFGLQVLVGALFAFRDWLFEKGYGDPEPENPSEIEDKIDQNTQVEEVDLSGEEAYKADVVIILDSQNKFENGNF